MRRRLRRDLSHPANPLPLGQRTYRNARQADDSQRPALHLRPKPRGARYKDEHDTRTRLSYGDWTDSEEEGYHYTWVNKFAGKWADNKRYFISDLPLYRYAEALLFKAEIENERGNVPAALTYLNRVAKRAYGIDNYYTASDYHSFKESLMTKRSEQVRRRRQELVELHPSGLRLHEDRTPRPPERDQHPAVAHHDRLHERKSEYPSNGRLQLKNTPR
ncbi:MAG: RagB/SusD family nutrient uptake outer membrane protein [Alistipes senegalensis]